MGGAQARAVSAGEGRFALLVAHAFDVVQRRHIRAPGAEPFAEGAHGGCVRVYCRNVRAVRCEELDELGASGTACKAQGVMQVSRRCLADVHVGAPLKEELDAGTARCRLGTRRVRTARASNARHQRTVPTEIDRIDERSRRRGAAQ